MARAETASASLRPIRFRGWQNRLPNPRIDGFSAPSRCCGAPCRFSSSPSYSRSVSAQPFRYSSSAAKPPLKRDRRSRRWPTISRSSSIIRQETYRANSGRTSAALEHALPAWAASGNREILLADSDGRIIATVPSDPQQVGRPLIDLLGPSQPLTTFGAAAGHARDHVA